MDDNHKHKDWLNIILEEGEGYYTEFKEKMTNIDKDMVAFVNASGGKILLGVSDNSQIKGFELSNAHKSRIESIAENCDPSIPVQVSDYGNWALIEIPEGKQKPYRCAGGFYMRNGASSQKMSTDDIISFIRYEQRYNFDEQEPAEYPENEFDQEKYKAFIDKCGISDKYEATDVIRNLGLAPKDKTPFKLNNAGVLLLGKHTQRYMPQSVVTCVLFKGREKLHVLDRKDMSDDLITNVEEAMIFLKKHLKLKYEISSLQRNEILELPEEALREALVNAVVHRDYFEKGANIMVEIFDDRVDITNPGGLPKGMTRDDLGKKSVTRNPLLAAMFLRADYIEKLGTGINRIQQAMNEAGLPKADFKMNYFFSAGFPRVYAGSEKSSKEGSEKMSQEMSQKTSQKTSQKIIELIKNNANITTVKIADELNMSRRHVARYMDKLKKQGVIKRIGPDKGGYWKVLDSE